jgi:hypothetical protein
VAKSYRLEVLERLSALLSGITVANGYDHDLADSVFRGRTVFGEEDPIPMLSVLESTKVDGGIATGANEEMRKGVWPLIVQGWVANDAANPTDSAYGLMADVEARLGRVLMQNTRGDGQYPEHYMLGTGNNGKGYLVTNIAFGPGVVSPPREQISTNAFFFLPVYLTLAEKLGQPYFSV